MLLAFLLEAPKGLAREGAEIVDLPLAEPTASASVFVSLEPPAIELPPFEEDASLLARLTTGERSRLWVLAIGSVLVLVGLLPPSVVAGR